MQEMKKRRIVIASVLKPVDDTRMFEKLGRTLARVAEVHIVGFPGKATPSDGIAFHQSGVFKRLSLQRLLQPWKVFFLLLRLRPVDVIISTHELLWPAALYKLIAGAAVYYDLQENYWRNIVYGEAFPKPVRSLLAGYVRLKERLLHPMIKRYLVAERAYLDEMPFIRSKSVLLENRYYGQVKPPEPGKRGRRLIFSGTLSRSTGVFAAIDLARKLHEVDDAVRLAIVGHCSRQTEYQALLAQIKPYPFIFLIGGDKLVPHAEIIRHIRESDFGIIAYDLSPATENRIPTKLYEYLANGVILMTPPHAPWVGTIRQYQEPIIFDPKNPDIDLIMRCVQTSQIHIPASYSGLLWSESEPLLLEHFPPLAR